MKEFFSLFLSLPKCCKEVKRVVLCVVYLMMMSNSYLGKLISRVRGEGELSTE